MAQYAQAYTLYSSVRPFGVTSIIAGMDEEGGPGLYMVEPSGVGWVCTAAKNSFDSKCSILMSCGQGYFGAATGRGRQAAKAELEKLQLPNLSIEEAVEHAARIIYIAHGDNSTDKSFELEMTWVRLEKGSTEELAEGATAKGYGKHEEVPRELVEAAEKKAKKSLVEDDDEDEEMKE